MIRVMIADDHALIRTGLKSLLHDTIDMSLACEAVNAQQTLELARIEKPDVLVLDIRMPDRSGYDILKNLKQEHPRLPILILSMVADPVLAIRILKSGGDGYITKDCIPEELVGAIRKVAAGEKYVSPALAVEMIVAGLDASSNRHPHEKLSEREFEVMRLIGRGRAAHEIAEELSISAKTVETYRSRMMEKMNFKSNAEIIRYTLQNNLID
jgi:DNA-binding NarL/FixJ family response regulator